MKFIATLLAIQIIAMCLFFGGAIAAWELWRWSWDEAMAVQHHAPQVNYDLQCVEDGFEYPCFDRPPPELVDL